jgi:hypothetical protein
MRTEKQMNEPARFVKNGYKILYQSLYQKKINKEIGGVRA